MIGKIANSYITGIENGAQLRKPYVSDISCDYCVLIKWTIWRASMIFVY